MQIKELMTKGAEALVPGATIQEAAQAMADADIGSLPVLSNGRVVGILTDRDIVVRVVAEGLPPAATMVREIMTSDIVHCYEDDDVEDAARIMGEKRVRRLVVLDEDDEFAGVVSLSDLDGRAAESSGKAPDDRDGSEFGGMILIKDELAAVETYKQVLQGLHAGDAGEELRRIENDHEEAARLLRENIGRLGIDVPSKPGAASAWGAPREAMEELSDDKTTIALLRKGEEREIEDYETALQDGTLDTRLKDLISEDLLPKTRAHAAALRRFLGDGPVV